MRTLCHRMVAILVILLIGGAGLPPGLAKGGRGPGHVYSRSAARPSSSAKPAPQRANNTQVPVKAVTAHTAVPHGIDKLGDIDTRINVQPRLPEKSVTPNSLNAKAGLSNIRNPYHQRTMSALPPRPTSPVGNAIGLPILPRGSLGPRDGLHATSPSIASPVVPKGATGRLAGIGVERVPHSTANVVSPAARQGAISGTGLAPRHLGPQIGRANAVAGIIGTTIKRIR
jgi:hypothetical protein